MPVRRVMQFSTTLNKFDEINRGVRMQDDSRTTDLENARRKIALNFFMNRYIWKSAILVKIWTDRCRSVIKFKKRGCYSFTAWLHTRISYVFFFFGICRLLLSRIRISNFVHDVSVSTWMCIVLYVDREWRGSAITTKVYCPSRKYRCEQKVESYH